MWKRDEENQLVKRGGCSPTGVWRGVMVSPFFWNSNFFIISFSVIFDNSNFVVVTVFGNHQRPDIAKEIERVRTVSSSTTDRAVGGNAQAPTKKRKVFLNLFSVSLHSSNTFGPTDKFPEPLTLCATHHRSTSTPYFCVIASGWITFPTDFDIFRPFSSSANPWTKTRLNGAVPRNATLVSRDVWNHAPYWSLPSTYKSATLSSPKTAAQDVPLSNQMSKMSVPWWRFPWARAPDSTARGRAAERRRTYPTRRRRRWRWRVSRCGRCFPCRPVAGRRRRRTRESARPMCVDGRCTSMAGSSAGPPWCLYRISGSFRPDPVRPGRVHESFPPETKRSHYNSFRKLDDCSGKLDDLSENWTIGPENWTIYSKLTISSSKFFLFQLLSGFFFQFLRITFDSISLHCCKKTFALNNFRVREKKNSTGCFSVPYLVVFKLRSLCGHFFCTRIKNIQDFDFFIRFPIFFPKYLPSWA